MWYPNVTLNMQQTVIIPCKKSLSISELQAKKAGVTFCATTCITHTYIHTYILYKVWHTHRYTYSVHTVVYDNIHVATIIKKN